MKVDTFAYRSAFFGSDSYNVHPCYLQINETPHDTPMGYILTFRHSPVDGGICSKCGEKIKTPNG